MANSLARVIMNNIAQNSKKIDKRSSSAKITHSVPSLDKREEELLLNVINKKTEKAIGNSRTLETLSGLGSTKSSLNLSTKSVEHNKEGYNSFEKVKLEDLVKGDFKSNNSSNEIAKKSNTMLTLSELAGKAKKTNENQKIDGTYSVKQNNIDSEGVYVKTGVINNLEAYIPKVSLDSIGKKGSLL